MTANYMYLYYGVRVSKAISTKYDLAQDYHNNIGKFNEELSPYDLTAQRHVIGESNDIILGQNLGIIDASGGLTTAKIMNHMCGVDEEQISDQIKRYLESIKYLAEAKIKSYPVPDLIMVMISIQPNGELNINYPTWSN